LTPTLNPSGFSSFISLPRTRADRLTAARARWPSGAWGGYSCSHRACRSRRRTVAARPPSSWRSNSDRVRRLLLQACSPDVDRVIETVLLCRDRPDLVRVPLWYRESVRDDSRARLKPGQLRQQALVRLRRKVKPIPIDYLQVKVENVASVGRHQASHVRLDAGGTDKVGDKHVCRGRHSFLEQSDLHDKTQRDAPATPFTRASASRRRMWASSQSCRCSATVPSFFDGMTRPCLSNH